MDGPEPLNRMSKPDLRPDLDLESDLDLEPRVTFTVVFTDCSTGLGIKIIGGLAEEEGDQDYGIFIRKVIPGGLAQHQGELQEGDQLLYVNKQDLDSVTNDEAVLYLREASASNLIELVVSRDDIAREEYDELLAAYSYSSASSMCEPNSYLSSHVSQSGGWASPLSTGYSCGPGSRPPGDTTADDASTTPHKTDASPLPAYTSPNSQQPAYPTPNSAAYPTPNSAAYPTPNSAAYPTPNSAAYPTPNSAAYPTPNSSAYPTPSYQPLSALVGPPAYSPGQPKVNNAELAASRPRAPRPNMTSTPHQRETSAGVSRPSAQDAATSTDRPPSAPSPVLPDASPLYTLPGLTNALPASHGQRHMSNNQLPNSHSQLPSSHGQLTMSHGQLPTSQRHASRHTATSQDYPRPSLAPGLPTILANGLAPSVLPDTSLPTSLQPSAHGYHDDGASPGSPGPQRLSRRRSLDPHVRLRVEKLQKALSYLGIEPSLEEQEELRSRLDVDANQTVTYKQFVAVAREIFKMQLEEKNFPHTAISAQDVQDFTEPPAFNPQLSRVDELRYREEVDDLNAENEQLKLEVRKLKKLLKEKEDELFQIRQDAHGALHESQSLRSKVFLVEQAQRAARSMEGDYQEVVRILEAEIRDLRQQAADRMEGPGIQKRMAVMGCQLRKAEVTKKTYEVATEKLLQFAEHVYTTMSGQGDSYSRPVSAASLGPRGQNLPPGYPGTKTGKPGANKPGAGKGLGAEAREVIKAVKSLMEVEPLPFGWEETYTADGMKYYINHVTQVTTWQHPLSNVQHDLPSIQYPDNAVPAQGAQSIGGISPGIQGSGRKYNKSPA